MDPEERTWYVCGNCGHTDPEHGTTGLLRLAYCYASVDGKLCGCRSWKDPAVPVVTLAQN